MNGYNIYNHIKKRMIYVILSCKVGIIYKNLLIKIIELNIYSFIILNKFYFFLSRVSIVVKLMAIM